MWVSGLTAALSAMPTSRLWAVGGSVSWPEKGSAPRAGAQLRRRDRPLVVLQLLGRARGSPRVPWGCPRVGGPLRGRWYPVEGTLAGSRSPLSHTLRCGKPPGSVGLRRGTVGGDHEAHRSRGCIWVTVAMVLDRTWALGPGFGIGTSAPRLPQWDVLEA